MNNFIVNLSIKDECCTKCGNNTIQKDVIIRSINQTIDLQGAYILNVIEVGPNFVKVLIQNGIRVFIRTVYTTFAIQLSLPADCDNKHVLTIAVEIGA